MEKQNTSIIKDGLTGLGMGAAIIVPGISAGTIALISGSYDKITNAAGHLASKSFLRNLLTLLPFGIGAILAIAGLYFPFNLAFKYCMLAIVALFAGLIAGSLPGIFDQIKSAKDKKINVLPILIGFVSAALIGVLSIILKTGNLIQDLFNSIPFYLYILIFIAGIISAAGIIVPGLSGSLILLVISFYKPILQLLEFNHGLYDLLLGICFGIGIVVGFILWSKLMNSVLSKHRLGTLLVVLGFVLGSLLSIFCNSNMISYIQNDISKLDIVLSPIFAILGIIGGYLFVVITRKHSD